MSINNTANVLYMRCRKRAESNSCEGCGTIRTLELEQLVYDSMVEKLREFNSLSSRRTISNNPKLTAAKVELAHVNADIEKLVDSLIGANTALLSFANQKAEEFETKKQALTKQVADLTDASIPAAKLTAISGYLNDWENTGFDDKRQVADSLVSIVRATSESIEIEWKI